jgi:hypothetical protein
MFAHSLEVHAIHRLVHPFYNRGHVAGHLSHCDRRLYTTRDSIHTAGQSQ